MTPRRGALAEPAMGYSDGWVQMMVLAERLRPAFTIVQGRNFEADKSSRIATARIIPSTLCMT